MSRKYFFTSESVTEGHPDKICDKISDGVLDALLAQDPMSRVACETTVTTGMIHLMGEISSSAQVDFASIARETVREIGYDRAKYGFDCDTCAVMVSIDKQSADIAMGVDAAQEAKAGSTEAAAGIGAGDQGMMFGYACDETEELMPMAIQLAHSLAKRLTDVRKNGTLSYLRPDGKTQVTVEYNDDQIKRVEAIVVSSQHDGNVTLEKIHKDIIENVITPIIPAHLLDENTKIYINPTGRFVVGGPQGDSGLTGRKIIVDTYGGYGRHGGGAFSGKDPTKVDRSAAYAARYVAKNIVKAGLAKKCEIEVSYAIGVATPLSVMAETFGTETVDLEIIDAVIKKFFDLRPGAIIEKFGLRRPIYKQVAAYGHMGREDLDMPWEQTDLAQEIAEFARNY